MKLLDNIIRIYKTSYKTGNATEMPLYLVSPPVIDLPAFAKA